MPLPLDFSGALWCAPAAATSQEGENEPDAAARLIANSFGAAARFLPDADTAWCAALDTVRAHHKVAGRPKRREFLVCTDAPLPPALARDAEVTRLPQDEDAVRAAAGPRTAGVIMWPARIEAGIAVLPGSLLAGIRELADEYGFALLFEESDAGLGRTGMAFAHEWTGVTPDLMLVGEGAGLPVPALVVTQKFARALPSGLPMPEPEAMAAVETRIAAALAQGFEGRIQALGWMLEDRLVTLRYRRPDLFADTVGMGLAQGLVCAGPAEALAERLAERGLLLRAMGEVLAVLPPLDVRAEEIAAAADILEAAVAQESGFW